MTINFSEAILSLRTIAVLASLITFFYIKKTLEFLKLTNPLFLLVFIFIPVFIQFGHFGTTESLLMAYIAILSYLSVKILQQRQTYKALKKYANISSLVIGLAIATKVSSLLFLIIPLLVLVLSPAKRKRLGKFYLLILIVLRSLVITIIFSPYNFISFNKFLSSIRYESMVATGSFSAFYIRQFAYSIPLFFQFVKIFPFALGWSGLFLFLMGFFMKLKDRKINFLRLSWLILFISSGLFFSKWSRFMAPVFPLMFVFSIIGLDYIWRKTTSRFLFFIFILVTILPGISYLSIYQNKDVRFKASNWIYKNIPSGARILLETANVVDVPFPTNNIENNLSNYNEVSFNFYNLDSDFKTDHDLRLQLRKTDYIIVPSRRIFYNHTCYQSDKNGLIKLLDRKWGYASNVCAQYRKKYPKLNRYYDQLFSGELGFRKVAQFSSFPRVDFFGFSLQFADEGSEETWTVFDHPVIRIYKKFFKT